MTKRRHILGLSRVLPFHSIGGMQAIAWDLFRALAEAGNQVTVLTTTIQGRPEAFTADGVDVVVVRGTVPERCNSAWWSGSREVARRLEAPPSIVMSISAAGAGLLPLKDGWPKTAFVFQAHGTSWGEFVSKWSTGRPLQWAKSIRNLYWLFKDVGIYKRFDQVVAVGDVVANQLTRWPHSRLTPKVAVRVIRNGVNTKIFKPDPARGEQVRRRLGWSDQDHVAVFAARLHPQKGARQALKAIEVLSKSRQDIKLLIVGSGEDEAALRRYVASSQLTGRVHFTGAVARAEMPSLLAAGNAFVFPSLRQEGLPMNVLEALACGLPAVCSSSMCTVFDPALDIRYTDPNDPSAMASEISAALLSGPYEASLLSPSYTLANCVEAYQDVFHTLGEN